MIRTTKTGLSAITILFAALLIVLISTGASFGSSAPAAKGTINSDGGAVLRSRASVSSGSITVLRDGTKVIIYREIFKKRSGTSAKNIWYRVKADGLKGYVRSDLIDNVTYAAVKGRTSASVKYRKGAGTGMKKAGSLKKNADVTVCLAAKPLSRYKGGSATWYRIKKDGRYYYVCSDKVKLTGGAAEDGGEAASAAAAAAGGNLSDEDFEAYMIGQGFPKKYRTRLMELHRAHRNWGFVAYKTNIKWSDALARQTRKGVSLVHKSYGAKYRSGSRQREPGWYNANSTVVAYYMDPRNFLNEDRIMMFEDLTYKPAYQTSSVVSTILAPTKLPEKGFSADIFINAASASNVSPVFLASRARQETGGGSDAINGVSVLGTKVYNPFNIGAFGGTNPLYKGLLYARAKGWTTQAKAVEGGAAELVKNYISRGQHTIYYQRFNVRNGLSSAGTHQYMTNIHAPYNEAYSTKTSYDKYGIMSQPLIFEIPVYKSMPGKTKLP